MPRLKILFPVSECVPFAKTGGLGDVAGALPKALAARGHDVRIVLPRYRVTLKHKAERLPGPLGVPVGLGTAWTAVWESKALGEGGPRVYLLEENSMFDREGIYGDPAGGYGDNLARYTLLSRGALELCRYLDWTPDVVHVHDWQTSLVPVYLDTVERGRELGQAASILTIHNMGYQGWFGKDELYQTGLGWGVYNPKWLEKSGSINLLKGGIYRSTLVTTVSPRYAREIQTPDGGEGLDGVLRDRGSDVLGVLNGIDNDVWNPEKDTHIAAPFSVKDLRGKALCKAALQREMGLPERPDVPLIGVVTRLAQQKGIDVIAAALHEMLSLNTQVVVLGSGEAWAESFFSRLSATTSNFRAFLGMNEGLSHRIEAGSDFFLMPSRYEPCGLNQMYSQRYGTLPIVRAVGGLDDTVEHGVTGYKFNHLSSDELATSVAWAVHVYRQKPEQHRTMITQSMQKRMGWDHAARQYEALYRLAVRRRLMGR